jgi:hypothetical protein
VVWALRALGARSAWFAFFVVWVPMVWLGTVSRFVRPRLPGAYHDLRGFERDGRMYELLGVVLAKRLLRRGPLAVFNPDLHLPAERTPENLDHLDQRMRDAEASHFCSSRCWGRRPCSRARLVGRRGLDPAVRRPPQRVPGDASAVQPRPAGQALQPLVDRWPSAPTARRKRRRTIQLTLEAVGPSTIEGPGPAPPTFDLLAPRHRPGVRRYRDMIF